MESYQFTDHSISYLLDDDMHPKTKKTVTGTRDQVCSYSQNLVVNEKKKSIQMCDSMTVLANVLVPSRSNLRIACI